MRSRILRRTSGREPRLGEGPTAREARLGGDAALLHTVEMLDHPDEQVRHRAALRLATLGDERAARGLEALLLSGAPGRLRARAARALGRLGDREAIPALELVMLSGEAWQLRGAAAEGLGWLAARGIEGWPLWERLALALSDPASYVRAKAAAGLGQAGAEALPLIREARAATDPRRREGAALALGRCTGGEAVEALIGALGDPDSRVRRAAAWSLGEQGRRGASPPAAAEALIGALGDPDRWVRPDAALALGKLGPAAPGDARIEPLEQALRDPNPWVRRAAVLALGGIGGEQALSIAALDDPSADVRHGAAQALGLAGDDRAIEPLIAHLSDRRAGRLGPVREAAAAALRQIVTRRPALAKRIEPALGGAGGDAAQQATGERRGTPVTRQMQPSR